ncbi:tyrosine-type recombinase/integrase [Polynucleobacter sp.]|uniref:tyrosine-type recombinase/integrase n=1 Tax=Polynucleobacter sp. TaxID=2029855 RepID=UPI00258775CB|nr:tyrosine-type recombinase/integrase [Polynucleobacter sp.]MCX7237280.1 tyrosine-type recombinase/integrase [Polynucleobacter sp.]
MARITQELSLKSKTFKQLAVEELESLSTASKEGKGKSVYRDYSFVINKYFIPFFGSYCLTDITPQIVQDFESWRDSQMGRHPMASTKRTHSAAYNRIVERARNQALIPKDLSTPLLDIQGAPGEARPAFSETEIAQLLAFMPGWEQVGHRGRTRSIRQLCRSYVEFLLFTGVRTGTETMPLRWKHLQWHHIGPQRYLKIWVSGKTGPRYLIAKHAVIETLNRLITFQGLPFEDLVQLLKSGYNRKIFVMEDGTQPYSLNGTFERLLKECNLLKDVSGRNRSLYSLRHTYATFALAEGVDIHTLARQMGTSTLMIERHYSKLTPMMAAAKLA